MVDHGKFKIKKEKDIVFFITLYYQWQINVYIEGYSMNKKKKTIIINISNIYQRKKMSIAKNKYYENISRNCVYKQIYI